MVIGGRPFQAVLNREIGVLLALAGRNTRLKRCEK
jgi:hypothetical protein